MRALHGACVHALDLIRHGLRSLEENFRRENGIESKVFALAGAACACPPLGQAPVSAHTGELLQELDAALVRWASFPQPLLRIVAAYYGGVPAIDYVLSPMVGLGGAWRAHSSVQMWQHFPIAYNSATLYYMSTMRAWQDEQRRGEPVLGIDALRAIKFQPPELQCGALFADYLRMRLFHRACGALTIETLEDTERAHDEEAKP